MMAHFTYVWITVLMQPARRLQRQPEEAAQMCYWPTASDHQRGGNEVVPEQGLSSIRLSVLLLESIGKPV